MNDLKMLPMTFKFFTDKEYIKMLYLVQFETHQNYHFQIIGQNMSAQFSAQLKVLIFGTCTKNILICSQVKF